jgi:hypothetical protein
LLQSTAAEIPTLKAVFPGGQASATVRQPKSFVSCPVHLERYVAGIMATPRAANTPMKMAQIPKAEADFEIAERNFWILRSSRPWSAQKPRLTTRMT